MNANKKIFLKGKTLNAGFTLVETMVAAGVVTVALAGLLLVFFHASALTTFSGNITDVMMEIQSKLTDIRSHDFDSLQTDFGSGGTPGNTFALTGANGMGVIYMTPKYPDLLRVKISVSWKDKNGRIIGEDLNLNGQLDAGEPDGGTIGELDSVAYVETYIAKR